MTKKTTVSLDTIKDGAVNDLFLRELPGVLENIMDPNTEAGTKRTITITIDLWSIDDRREIVQCLISCKPKLAVQLPVITSLAIGRERFGDEMLPVAYEIEGSNPNQLGLLSADDLLKQPSQEKR